MHLPGGKTPPDRIAGAVRHDDFTQAGRRANRFVKFDYLLIVNDTVVQSVLVASSRFSIKTGGCGR